MCSKTKSANVAVIKLNKKFYDEKSIKSCLEDFSASCSTDFRDNGEKFEIVVRSKGRLCAKKVGYEFCNYLLAFMKNNNKV
jgi:hypothetical protein